MQKINENEYVTGMQNVCITHSSVFDIERHPLLRAVEYSKKGLYIDDSWGIPKLKGVNILISSETPTLDKNHIKHNNKTVEPYIKKTTSKFNDNYYTERLSVSLDDIIL